MNVKRFALKEYFPELGRNGCEAYVDCYIPREVKELGMEGTIYPGIIICPGGAYEFLSDREGEPLALKFAAQGYRAFVLHYSVAPHRFPQQLREVAGVMELLYKYAKEWFLDPQNIAILGCSAGGHLACQYSNRYADPVVRNSFPESKPVQKAILAYPVITAQTPYGHMGSMRNLLGHEPTNPNEEGISCENIATCDTPPTFVWHTAEDEIVPVENSVLYVSALAKYKVPFELHIYPKGPHGLATADATTCTLLSLGEERVAQWFHDCLLWLKNK